MITLLTTFNAKDEASARELAGLLAALGQTVPSEPGNRSYEVLASVANPLVFYIRDSWDSQLAIDEHLRLLTRRGDLDKVAGLLSEPLTAARLTAL